MTKHTQRMTTIRKHTGLEVNGYEWYKADNFFHYFKRALGGRYAIIKCRELDIENGNIYDMTAYGVSL